MVYHRIIIILLVITGCDSILLGVGVELSPALWPCIKWPQTALPSRPSRLLSMLRVFLLYFSALLAFMLLSYFICGWLAKDFR